jgi:ATP-dependent DNA helicase RecG
MESSLIMENNELKILIDELRLLTKETDWVEFKSSTIKPIKRLGDYISGLSNATCSIVSLLLILF